MDISIQTISVLVIATGVVVAILQLNAIKRQIKAQHDWNRRVTALKFTFSDDPHVREVRARLDEHLKIGSRSSGEINIQEIHKLSNDNYPEISTDLPFVLGKLEATCVAIKNGVADEQTCKDMIRGVVVLYYRFFSQYIDDMRKLRNNDKLYEFLEHYARKWDKKTMSNREFTG
jgi:hypothetical protein